METLLIFLGMALATFFTRYAMIAALGREMSPLLRRWLRYVPPAVLAALIVPPVLAPQGDLEAGLRYPPWLEMPCSLSSGRIRCVVPAGRISVQALAGSSLRIADRAGEEVLAQ